MAACLPAPPPFKNIAQIIHLAETSMLSDVVFYIFLETNVLLSMATVHKTLNVLTFYKRKAVEQTSALYLTHLSYSKQQQLTSE